MREGSRTAPPAGGDAARGLFVFLFCRGIASQALCLGMPPREALLRTLIKFPIPPVVRQAPLGKPQPLRQTSPPRPSPLPSLAPPLSPLSSPLPPHLNTNPNPQPLPQTAPSPQRRKPRRTASATNPRIQNRPIILNITNPPRLKHPPTGKHPLPNPKYKKSPACPALYRPPRPKPPQPAP